MGLETTESIAGQIGTSEVQGNWRQMETFTQAVQNLTVEQINAAFKNIPTRLNGHIWVTILW